MQLFWFIQISQNALLALIEAAESASAGPRSALVAITRRHNESISVRRLAWQSKRTERASGWPLAQVDLARNRPASGRAASLLGGTTATDHRARERQKQFGSFGERTWPNQAAR